MGEQTFHLFLPSPAEECGLIPSEHHTLTHVFTQVLQTESYTMNPGAGVYPVKEGAKPFKCFLDRTSSICGPKYFSLC